MGVDTYFIRCCDSVKIGRTSNLKSRLSSIQTCNPHEVELLAWFAEDERFENEVHSDLADARVRGEWFNAVDAVEWLIDWYDRRTLGVQVPNGFLAVYYEYLFDLTTGPDDD